MLIGKPLSRSPRQPIPQPEHRPAWCRLVLVRLPAGGGRSRARTPTGVNRSLV